MLTKPDPLLSLAHLSYDFERGTITGEGGQLVGSTRWSRRPGSRLAHDLGFRDAGGHLQWWLRPAGFRVWSPDLVLAPDGAVIGDITDDGLRVGGRVLGTLERQRFRFYLPEWQINGDTGFIAEVRLERRWTTGDVSRRELWHLRLSPDVGGPLRCLAAAAPYACWRWYHWG